jgi:type II secretory pathway component PulJ
MLIPKRHRSLDLADSAGFMLIETLVAIISATVVTGALFAILIVSLHQTSRISGRLQATELGRTTMTRMVDELHSACIAKEFLPLQEKSSPTELIFISGVGEEAVLKKAALHKIVYNESAGTLVETTTPSSGGEWPTFEYKGTPTTTRIGQYITAAKSGGTKPIFQYYKYAQSSNSTNALSTLEQLPVGTGGLNEAQAKEATAVGIAFTAGASEGSQYKPTVELTDQATLAFTAPSAETPIVQKPCE